MKNLLLIFTAILLLSGCKTKSITDNNYFVTDDMQNKVGFEKIPQRVISLSPSVTEIIYSLNFGDKLIGNTNYCDYPDPAKNIEKVSDLISANYEKIIALKPDLVFLNAEGNTKDMADKLRSLKVKIFIVNPRNFSGIIKAMTGISSVFRNTTALDSIREDWRKQNIQLNEQIKSPLKIYFFVSVTPLMVVAGDTFMDEIITKAGLKNLAGNLPGHYPVISREEILNKDPEAIIISGHSAVNLKEMFRLYPEWKKTKAYKNDNIKIVNSDVFNRPGPRIYMAVSVLKNLDFK